MSRKYLTMGALLLALLLAALLLNPAVGTISAQPASQGPTYKLVSNGDFAQIEVSDSDHYGYVYVSRGGPVNDPQTYLVYFSSDLYNLNYEVGYGAIPNSAFQYVGAKTLKLFVDPGTVPGFTIDPPGSARVIDLQWNKWDFLSWKEIGNGQMRFGNWRRIWSGLYEYSWATVGGRFSRWVLSGAQGIMGTNQNMTIEIGITPSTP